MKKIICNLQLFDLQQTIYIANSESESETENLQQVIKVPVSELVEAIATLSHNQQIFSLVINGNKSFGNELAKKIVEYSNIHYSENILEIEVK